MRNQFYASAKTKSQINFAVTDRLINTFVFATQIVKYFFFLNLKFQASSHLLWLYSLFCVGPGWKSRKQVFSPCVSNCIFDTVMILAILAERYGQTVQTKNRLLLESDKGLHCLHFSMHLFEILLSGTEVSWKSARRFRRRRFLKGFYHIWAWLPYWSCDQHHFNKFSFPCT